MAPLQKLLAASALTSLSLAAPTPTNTTASACAQVSTSARAQVGVVPTVAAQLAWDCLQSAPLNKTAALSLIEGVKPYFDWQSTTAWLKDPPAEYVDKVQDPVDIFGELDAIKAKVESGEWTKEYEFGWALYTLTQSTHDGHFVFVPDSVGEIFNFGRPVALVSVSKDGYEEPQPYVYSDILAQSFGNATFEPSEIVQINGEDALNYLENWSQYGSLQDRDALYNNVFYELAVVSLGGSGAAMGTFTGGGRGRWVYPGPTTELTFANGSSTQYPNFARVLASFSGITTGEELAARWFNVPANTTAGINVPGQPDPNKSAAPSPTSSTVPEESATVAAVAAAATTPAPGYPPPIIRHTMNYIGGYYIDAEGFEDVAVLSIPSFVGGSGQEQFQSVARKFLDQAKAEGKTKLIVDVSANGGGTILLGYDIFKQLFPSEPAFAAYDRFRSFEATDLIGEKYSNVTEGFERTLAPSEAEFQSEIVSSIFNYRTDLQVDGTPFPNWDAKIGPVESKDDSYSAGIRWNLSDTLTPYNSGGIYVSNEPTANTTQPFAAEDIVLLTDGYCASTCTIFAQLLRDVAGVKFISIGGRSNSDPSQAIGGVKGTNNFPWTYIQTQVSYVYNWSTPLEAAEYDKTSLITYNDDAVFYRAASGVGSGVNFRDGVRPTDADAVPLQFVYEESDCRLFYTPEMTVDVTAIWKAVAETTWKGQSHCVAGNLGNTYSTRRGLKAKPVNRRRPLVRRKKGSVEEYPLDLYTDLSGMGDNFGWMMP